MKMKRKLLIQMADPAGNKTAYVLNGARKEEYAGIADYIMNELPYGAEQVAFVTGTDSIDMSGMEFCGNAARAFALMSVKGMIDGKAAEDDTVTIPVTVSEAEKPVECVVRQSDDYTRVSMPLPKRTKVLKHCVFADAEGKTVVVFDGIIHLIADGIKYTEENFNAIKQALIDQFDPAALGVMYLDPETLEMTPVVHVRNVGSTFIEGSCGSGTTAAAFYLSNEQDDGEYQYEISQPAGKILATSVITDGKPSEIFIEGPVTIDDPVFVEAEYEVDDDVQEPEFDFI